ncbi:hypothetical protein AB0I28_32255 [Phytomonospora sp. NPDC050363]
MQSRDVEPEKPTKPSADTPSLAASSSSPGWTCDALHAQIVAAVAEER